MGIWQSLWFSKCQSAGIFIPSGTNLSVIIIPGRHYARSPVNVFSSLLCSRVASRRLRYTRILHANYFIMREINYRLWYSSLGISVTDYGIIDRRSSTDVFKITRKRMTRKLSVLWIFLSFFWKFRLIALYHPRLTQKLFYSAYAINFRLWCSIGFCDFHSSIIQWHYWS